MSIMCKICGKNFIPKVHNQVICGGEDCRKTNEMNNRKARTKANAELMKEHTKTKRAQIEVEAVQLDGKVLDRAEMTVDEYNRTHGTNYSYGQYVHYVESRGI